VRGNVEELDGLSPEEMAELEAENMDLQV